MAYEILEKIKKAIEQHEDDPKWEEIGKVIEAGDGIIKLSGLNNVQSQEVISVETKEGEIEAVALNLEEDSVGALILGDASAVKSGQTCKRTGKILSISVGKQLLGRVIDPLGRPLDGKGPIFSKADKPTVCCLENEAPNVLNRETVNVPLHTGIKAIDSMIPIGRGQRELIIGDRQTGKTAIALDIIINQLQENKKNPPVCIYVAIGQKESKIAKIVETLKKYGAFDYTIVVSASASSSASFWYLAPFAGCAVGEYFRDNGQDAVIIYDDLSKHAWAYRQISLLLRRPPGREAYPRRYFYLHSRLLERAARLSADKGGGSLTALPIVETQLGDVTAYIPTNVISITDGQIYLESDLFFQGIRPAINVGLSVSRVGSSAQTKAMKKVAGKLRLELAQFRELQRFVQFSSDVDESTKKRICKGRIITEILKQTDLTPLPFEKQVAVLYGALNGYFDALNPEGMVKMEADLLVYLENFHKNVLDSLKEKKQLSEDLEKELQSAIKSFVDKLK